MTSSFDNYRDKRRDGIPYISITLTCIECREVISSYKTYKSMSPKDLVAEHYNEDRDVFVCPCCGKESNKIGFKLATWTVITDVELPVDVCHKNYQW